MGDPNRGRVGAARCVGTKTDLTPATRTATEVNESLGWHSSAKPIAKKRCMDPVAACAVALSSSMRFNPTLRDNNLYLHNENGCSRILFIANVLRSISRKNTDVSSATGRAFRSILQYSYRSEYYLYW
jgi:ribosomal protein L28